MSDGFHFVVILGQQHDSSTRPGSFSRRKVTHFHSQYFDEAVILQAIIIGCSCKLLRTIINGVFAMFVVPIIPVTSLMIQYACFSATVEEKAKKKPDAL